MARSHAAGAKDQATPRAAVGRLSLYLRHLETLLQAGQNTVSSRQLGRALQTTDAQVRKRPAYFGQFGYPGVGYRVTELRDAYAKCWEPTGGALAIGVGNLGRARSAYAVSASRGFAIVAAFDVRRR